MGEASRHEHVTPIDARFLKLAIEPFQVTVGQLHHGRLHPLARGVPGQLGEGGQDEFGVGTEVLSDQAFQAGGRLHAQDASAAPLTRPEPE